jgi:hypothetical protein
MGEGYVGKGALWEKVMLCSQEENKGRDEKYAIL